MSDSHVQNTLSDAVEKFDTSPSSWPGSLPSFDGTSTRFSTWVGIISAIIGGLLGLGTWQMDIAKSVDSSVEKSYEMIFEFNSEAMSPAREHVRAYTLARRACDARIVHRELTDADFIRVIEFYDVVHSCVQAGLCDAAAAKSFFGPRANYHWPILEVQVAGIKSYQYTMHAGSDLGHGMAAFATDPVAAEPCSGNF